MNVHPALFVGVYFLIGIFVSSVIHHAANDDEYSLFVLYTCLWPIVVCGLIAFIVLIIPYILGKWVGHSIQGLVRAIK